MSKHLEKLTYLVEKEFGSKQDAAIFLDTSPRTIGRWLSGEHPIRERVKEILDTEYPDDSFVNAPEKEMDIVKTFIDELSDLHDIEKSIVTDEELEKIEQELNSLSDDLSVHFPEKKYQEVNSVIATVIHFNQIVHPLEFIVKKSILKEGKQFSTFIDENSNALLVNMRNVSDYISAMRPLNNIEVQSYIERAIKLEDNNIYIVTQEGSIYTLTITLSELILLKGGLVPSSWLDLSISDMDDIAFIAISSQLSKDL